MLELRPRTSRQVTFRGDQVSQSSGSQPPRELQTREQRHWRRNTNSNAVWGGSQSWNGPKWPRYSKRLQSAPRNRDIKATTVEACSSRRSPDPCSPRLRRTSQPSPTPQQPSLFLQTVRAVSTKQKLDMQAHCAHHVREFRFCMYHRSKQQHQNNNR